MTYHFELGRHPGKTGKYTIFLKLYHEGERKRIKTSVEVLEKDWDPQNERVRKSSSSSREDNSELERLRDRARAVERDLLHENRLTLYRFLERFLDHRQEYQLLAYAAHLRELQAQQKQWGTYKKYGDSISKLSSYTATLGVPDMDFRDIDARFVEGYTQYLIALPNRKDPSGGRTLSPNSVAKHLKILRAILNKAVLDGHMRQDDIPRRLTTVKETPPAVTGLRDVELRKILGLPLKEGSDRWHARNAFLFAMYEGGIRIGDLLQLRWANITDGRLIYRMGKNGKHVDIVLVQEAERILRRYRRPDQRPQHYVFPYLDNGAEYAKYVSYEERLTMSPEMSRQLFKAINCREARIGRLLREIGAVAGVRFTFHTARHTFALRAKDAGTDNAVLKNILRHSSLNTTETYINRLDTSKEDSALKVMYQDKAHLNKEKKRIAKQIQKLGLTAEELQELLNQG